jgi:hypothetical protein
VNTEPQTNSGEEPKARKTAPKAPPVAKVDPAEVANALELINSCRFEVRHALQRLRTKSRNGTETPPQSFRRPKASYYLSQLLRQTSLTVAECIRAGDLSLVSDLHGVIQTLEDAGGQLARSLDPRGGKPRPTTAAAIIRAKGKAALQKERSTVTPTPRAMIDAGIRAILPSLSAFVDESGEPGPSKAQSRHLIARLQNRKTRRAALRQVLTTHRGAIEHIFDEAGDSRRIRTFAAYLERGWYWNSGDTFELCPWHGRPEAPTRREVSDFLKAKLRASDRWPEAFDAFVASRRSSQVNDPLSTLSDDRPTYILNQIVDRIQKSFPENRKK